MPATHTSSGSPHRTHCCEHRVAFYRTDDHLTAMVADFLVDGLEDAGAVVIATPAHRARFADALRDATPDVSAVAAAVADRRLIMLDAAETLASFMGPDGPDPARFAATVGPILERAGAGGRPVRAYGEMVALLWAQGDPEAAIALERCWNELSRSRAFELLCAYPIDAGTEAADIDALARICRTHTDIVPAEPAATDEDAAADPALPFRAVIAEVQQELADRRRAVGRANPRQALVPGAVTPAVLADHRRARLVPGPRAEARLREDLLDALVAGDAAAAALVLHQALEDGLKEAAVFARGLAPVMHEIGARWAAGTMSIADEHLATATCSRAIAALYPALLAARPRSRERLMIAGVHGERHALAPRIVADLLEAAGYDVVHLGADVPPGDLAASVARFDPELVALSVTHASSASAVARAMAEVQRVRPGMLFLLGGQGVDRALPAAGFPVAGSVEDAVPLVEHLLRQRPAMPRASRLVAPADRLVPGPASGSGGPPLGDEFDEIVREHALQAHEYRLLAFKDPLTGLANRRAFDDHLRAATADEPGRILLVADVDRFKAINDTHGHQHGDAVLVDVAECITSQLDPGDVAARLGGDEFAILLATDRLDSAVATAERILGHVRLRCAADGATLSVGAATLGDDPRLAILEADRALYRAKAGGRDAVALSGSAHAEP